MELSFVLGIFSLARCPAAGSSGGRGCQVLPRVHCGDVVSQCHVLASLHIPQACWCGGAAGNGAHPRTSYIF